MSHRLRSMMPWPARHQSRTISPELLVKRPLHAHARRAAVAFVAQRPERELALVDFAVLAHDQAVVRGQRLHRGRRAAAPR
jgi:hypothetical protein